MVCQKCGEELAEGQQFCPNCGAPVAEAVAAAPVIPVASTPMTLQPGAQAVARKRSKAGAVIGIVVGVVAILVVAYLLLRAFAPSVLRQIPLISQLSPTPTGVLTAARDLNLDESEVGDGYTLSVDEGMEEWADKLEDLPVRDFSSRTFVHGDDGWAAFQVITLEEEATQAVLESRTGAMAQELASAAGLASLEELAVPAVGDDATLHRGTLPDELGFVYVMGFRQENVIGLLCLVGSPDSASEANIVQLGQKMAQKIP